MAKGIKIPGENFQGGGGGSGGGLLWQLTEEELNQYSTAAPNTFSDSFDTDLKGTKTTCAASGDCLKPTGANLTWSYERKLNSGVDLSKMSEAYWFPTLKSMAPKATTIAANVIKFENDVTDMFGTAKKIGIYMLETSDGAVQQTWLYDLAGNVARLTATASYAGGETSLTVTNPDSLDLSMGLTNTDYKAKLRVVELDYKWEVSCTESMGNPVYEEAEIDLACIEPHRTIRIPGENTYAEVPTSVIAQFSGSVLKWDTTKSQDGIWFFGRALVKTAGNADYYWLYSTDDITYIKINTAKTSNNTLAEEQSGNYDQNNETNLFVANNGKAFSTYNYYDGSNNRIRAIYTDLSIGTPTITDSANTTELSGAGYIGGTGRDRYSSVHGDPIDGSFIAVAAANDVPNLAVYWFTAGGSVFDSYGLSTSQNLNYSFSVNVQGTGTSHRTHVFSRSNSNGYLYHSYVEQGSTTELGLTAITGYASNLLSVSIVNNRAFVLNRDESSSYLSMITGTVNGTPSWSSSKTLSTLDPDLFQGYSSSSYRRAQKNLNRRHVQNPSDEKHVYAVMDLIHSDSTARQTGFEITDISAFQGAWSSQYSAATYLQFGQSNTYYYVAETFAYTTANRIRTIAVRLCQPGSIAAGYAITCTINSTSGGTPTSTVLYTAENTVDPSMLSKVAYSSSPWVYFTFNDPVLVNGTYAIVLSGNFPVSGTNYVQWATSGASSGGYTGTNLGVYTGQSTKLVYEINGEWVTDLSAPQTATDIYTAHDDTNSPSGVTIHNQESQIVGTQITTRSTPANDSDSYRLFSGHVFRRVLSWGSGGVKSLISDSQIAGYLPTNYDPYLIFNTAVGASSCAAQDVTTGVVSTTNLAEDRSGKGLSTSSYTAVTYTTDANYDQGVKGIFNGSSSVIVYSGYARTITGKFEAIAEIQSASSSGARVIFFMGNYASNVFALRLAAGYLDWSGGGVNVTASDAVESSSYHLVKVTGDGSTVKLWRSPSVGGTWTEVSSYSSHPAQPASIPIATTGISIGAGYSGGWTDYFSGNIGLVKVLFGNDTEVYTGFKSQPAHVHHQNLGNKISAKEAVGTNGTTLGTNFMNPGIISDANGVVFVDSYDSMFRFRNKTLAAPGKKIAHKFTGGRASTRDISSMQGFIMQFDK